MNNIERWYFSLSDNEKNEIDYRWSETNSRLDYSEWAFKNKDLIGVARGWTTIERLRVGDFFKRKPDSKKVLLRQKYNGFAKKYSANDFDDINSYQHFKKGTLVFTDFEF